jgi:hypothetical protein
MAIRPWRQQPEWRCFPGLMVAEAYMTHLASALKMSSSLGSENPAVFGPKKMKQRSYSKGGKLLVNYTM